MHMPSHVNTSFNVFLSHLKAPAYKIIVSSLFHVVGTVSMGYIYGVLPLYLICLLYIWIGCRALDNYDALCTWCPYDIIHARYSQGALTQKNNEYNVNVFFRCLLWNFDSAWLVWRELSRIDLLAPGGVNLNCNYCWLRGADKVGSWLWRLN